MVHVSSQTTTLHTTATAQPPHNRAPPPLLVHRARAVGRFTEPCASLHDGWLGVVRDRKRVLQMRPVLSWFLGRPPDTHPQLLRSWNLIQRQGRYVPVPTHCIRSRMYEITVICSIGRDQHFHHRRYHFLPGKQTAALLYTEQCSFIISSCSGKLMGRNGHGLCLGIISGHLWKA